MRYPRPKPRPKRKPRRQKLQIKAWLVLHELTVRELARRLDIHDTTIHDTIAGKKNNRRALRGLLDIGVPEHLLDLPDDLKAEQPRAAANC